VIQVKGINMEALFSPNMLYVTNQDKPGFIGSLGALLAEAEVNIATFNLGRAEAGGDAIALVGVDQPVDTQLIEKIKTLPLVMQAKPLSF